MVWRQRLVDRSESRRSRSRVSSVREPQSSITSDPMPKPISAPHGPAPVATNTIPTAHRTMTSRKRIHPIAPNRLSPWYNPTVVAARKIAIVLAPSTRTVDEPAKPAATPMIRAAKRTPWARLTSSAKATAC